MVFCGVGSVCIEGGARLWLFEPVGVALTCRSKGSFGDSNEVKNEPRGYRRGMRM